MTRIVFVNLHGNEFLLKTLSKFVYKQSVAIKHKYILDYLLGCDDIEVCSFINKRGFSLSYSTNNPLLQSFRFLEHKIALKKNNICLDRIKVLKSESELRDDDIIIVYQYYQNQLLFNSRPKGLVVDCMIHFSTAQAELVKKLNPDVIFNEANFSHESKIFNKYYDWYKNEFITIPFVPADRFISKIPFEKRKNMAVSVGTITYMHNITDVYGDPCAQPARKQIKDHSEELLDIIECRNSDYLEDNNLYKTTSEVLSPSNLYKRIYNRFHSGRQKKYYSFDMVDKFNEYKMCIVGEEIMGIPGIGFVEGMACGCALIGQTVGYYEDYGMKEGVHYIGYDGSLKDLREKIEYYQREENQEKLKSIAANGQDYVTHNFKGSKIAEELLRYLIRLNKEKNK